MKVNKKKTALLCVSAAYSFDVRIELKFNGQEVKGRDSLKILGVTLDRDSTFTTHIEEISKRLRRKT